MAESASMDAGSGTGRPPGTMPYLIGVDGGGTRTTVVIADAAGAELHRGQGPPGLVDPRNPAATAEALAGVIGGIVSRAGCDPPAAALCAGLAGAAYAAEREAVTSVLLASGLARRVVVRTDGEIALEAAFGGGPGILLISGTGSTAYARSDLGATARCGGWGMWVGDEGSGYAIGRAALRAALQASDGRGPPTSLLELLLHDLQLPEPSAVPPWIGRASKAQVAALVPLVIDVAAAGDEVAKALLEQAAEQLARHGDALADRFSPWNNPPSVVLSGGVAASPGFRPFLQPQLERFLPWCPVIEPAASPVMGAVRIATAQALARPGTGSGHAAP